MIEKINITITVNNKKLELAIEPRLLLVDFIRNNLNLTGTHVGCDTSQCGSCMVFLNGQCVKACTVLVAQCNLKHIETIESIGTEHKMHDVQKAFKNNHGLQCGFCTPGIILSAIEMKKNNISTENEIRKFLDGNLCRCTGYHNIVKSISEYLNIKNKYV
tara:strand:- start:52 stop:531 length:480 start_codon:yes stop_codon:yes gene_type:complete